MNDDRHVTYGVPSKLKSKINCMKTTSQLKGNPMAKQFEIWKERIRMDVLTEWGVPMESLLPGHNLP